MAGRFSMHTFFINTTNREIEKYSILFDIGYENRNLIPMSCVIDHWFDAKDELFACADRIIETIDIHSEMVGEYNLIIAIDISAFKPEQEDNTALYRKEANSAALRMLLEQAVCETLLSRLEKSGRKPNESLIMFVESKNSDKNTDVHKGHFDEKVAENLFEYIGIPNKAVLECIGKESRNEELDGDGFKSKLIDSRVGTPVVAAEDIFAEEFELFCENIIAEGNVADARNSFFERITKLVAAKAKALGLKTVSCPIDVDAEKVTKFALALNRLNLACYVLTCMYAGTTLVSAKDGSKQPLNYHEYSAKELASALKLKEMKFKSKVEELIKIDTAFHNIELVPALYEFDYAKFGMDQYGRRGLELVECEDDADAEEANEPENASKDANKDSLSAENKRLTAIRKRYRNLLEKDGFVPFDYSGKAELSPNSKTTPDEYVKLAKKLRLNHINYLNKLKTNLLEILSRYSGKSDDNTPAMLEKRRVSMSDPQYEDDAKEYRYASDRELETKQLKTVKTLSDEALTTVTEDYLEFCAGRTLTVTDIEEQCDWFVTKIRRIQESIKQIGLMAGVLAGLLLTFLIPYLVIQWKSITASPVSILTALGSIAGPIVLLSAAIGAVAAGYKRKYRKAWDELVEKSNEALENNSESAELFDKLLCSVIPALRWVNEYKLDVEFYEDCCTHARAKLKHHIGKLRDRVECIGNMITDLDCASVKMGEKLDSADTDEIDYNMVFCSGERNIAFYTIIDREFLNENVEARGKRV